MRRFENKLAIITASTAGIGLEIARKLGSEGARAVISSRKESNVQTIEKELLKEGFIVKGVVCHVGDRKALQNLVQEAVEFGQGKIDILISNAAVNPTIKPLSTIEETTIDTILNINVKSPILLVQECIPYFAKDASIVFNSSYAAFQPVNRLDALRMYAISKTALLGVTKAFAIELGKKGIRVNCVAPGFILTKLSAKILENQKFKTELIQSIPLRRLGQTQDVANLVAFLVSKEAEFITGETIVISGGLQSRL